MSGDGQYAHNIARRDAILATARMSPQAKARALGLRYHPPMATPAVVATPAPVMPKRPAPLKPKPRQIVIPSDIRPGHTWPGHLPMSPEWLAEASAKARSIIRVCCAVFKIDLDALMWPIRSKYHSTPRQAAMALMAMDGLLSYPSIGKIFHVGHSSVQYAAKEKVPKMLEEDRAFRIRYRWAMRKLRRMWAAS